MTANEKTTEDALNHPDDLTQVINAIPAAEDALKARVKYQGSAWWESVNARLRVADLRLFSGLSVEKRSSLAEASHLTEQWVDRYKGKQYAQSLDISLKIVGIYREVLGEHHRLYAGSLFFLAYRRALEIERKTLGEDGPEYGANLISLGRLYDYMGRPQDAEPLFRHGLDALRKAVGEQNVVYSNGLMSLAAFLQEQAHYEEAEVLYQKGLDIVKLTQGVQSENYARCLVQLADFRAMSGHYLEAETLFRQALGLLETTVGESDEYYGFALRKLATMYALTDRKEEAARMAILANQIRWRNLTQKVTYMSGKQKKELLDRSNSSDAELVYILTFAGAADPKIGLQAALLGKQLQFEVARQENGALVAAVGAASKEWREGWQDLEQLRQEYAALQLDTLSGNRGGKTRGPGTPGSAVGTSQGDRSESILLREVQTEARRLYLQEKMDQFEQDLRRGNPAYAARAQIKQVTVDDVSHALRSGEALVEYVRYEAYDLKTRKWAGSHYGALMLLGGSGAVAAFELGNAEAVDAAVKRFRT